MKLLLAHQKFTFTENDLLGLVPYHARQIKSSGQVKAALNMCTEEIQIICIGDKQGETLAIPQEYREKIVSVKKYCTKPELEMLLILSENLFDAFDRVKSKTKPKEFAKQNIRHGRKKYDNSTKFFSDYYGTNCDELVRVIKEYKQKNSAHKHDQLYLADLLG